nr:hypothetical protein 12 [Spirochaetaceae bacterium]
MSGRITLLRHIFRSDRETLPIQTGKIGDILNEIGLGDTPVICIVNDETVTDGERVINEDDLVIIRAVPAGNPIDAVSDAVDDTVNSVTGAVNDIGQGIADFGNTLWMGLVVAPFELATWAVNKSIERWIEDRFGSPVHDPGSNKRLPTIRGSRNRANPWGAIPVVLGKHYIAPPLATTPYSELSGSTQYFRQLFMLGYGPLAIEDVRIGETPIGDFEGVTEEWRITDATMPNPVTIVPSVVDETSVNVKLDNTYVLRTTSLDTTEIAVEINYPRGVVRFDSDGKRQNTTVETRVQCRPHSGGAWETVKTFTATAKDSKQIRQAHTFTPPTLDPAGQYDVQVTRVTALNEDDNKITDDVYWSTLRSFVNQDPVADSIQPITARYAVRIRATDQLSGALEQLNMVAHSIVPDYTGSGSGSSSWVAAPTSNPASLYLWLLRGPAAGRPVDDAQIDWPTFEAWHAFCETNELEYNDYVQGKQPISELAMVVAGAGRAQPTRRDGKYSIVIDQERTTPIQLFTARNSSGFKAVKAFVKHPHALKIQFVNAAMGYQQDECIVYADGYNAGNASEYETIRLRGVTSYEQAWKEGRYRLAVRRLRPEVYSLTVDMEHFVATRGDLVRVQNDVILVGITSGRVTEVTTSGTDVTGVTVDEALPIPDGETCAVRIRLSDGRTVLREINEVGPVETQTVTFATPIPEADAPEVGDLFAFGISAKETGEYLIESVKPGDDLTATLTLVDHSPAIYQADTGVIPPFDSNVTPPAEIASRELPPAPVITAVWSDDSAALVASNGSVTQRMIVSWELPETDVDVTLFEIKWGIVGSPAAPNVASVSASLSSFATEDITVGAEHSISIRAVTHDGERGPEATTTHVVSELDWSQLVPGIPTTGDVEDGTVGGTPVALTTPAVAVAATQRKVSISISKQPDLTAASLVYDVQISKDQVSAYALGPGGTGADDWRTGLVDGYTSIPTEAHEHNALPLAGDAGAPAPATYYYRARRRTNAATSDWSPWASVTVSPLVEIDYGAGTITAPKMAVASVTAAALVADEATIDKLFGTTANIDALFAKSATVTNIQAIELSADKITAGTLDVARIGAGSLTANEIDTTNLASDTGFIATLTAQSAFVQDIQAINLSADRITAGTLDVGRIGAGSLTAEKIDIADLFSQSATIQGTLTIGSAGKITSGSAYTLDDTGITAVAGDIGSWLINPGHLRSAAAGTKRIDLNAIDNRVEVWATGEAEPKNAMGFAGGLSNPANRSQTLGTDIFGFWSSQGNKISFFGDADLSSGQWILQQDASMDVVDTDGDALLRYGTNSGGKGLFYWSNPSLTPGDSVLEASLIGQSGGWSVGGNLEVSGYLTSDNGWRVYPTPYYTNTIGSAGWYTIAANGGNRASAHFVIRDTQSGQHSAVHFIAQHHYGNGNHIVVLANSSYGSGGILRHIRILEGGTYDGAVVQVYVDAPGTVGVWVDHNYQSSGWDLQNWTTNDQGLSNVGAQYNLDTTDPGMGTTGTFTVGGAATVSGNLSIGGNLDVSGNINLPEGSYYLYDGVLPLRIAKDGSSGTTYWNTHVGADAGSLGVESQTAVGYSAGGNNTGIRQTAIGYEAGKDNTGSYQTAVGMSAGRNNSGLRVTALGYSAAEDNTANNVVAIGYEAGKGNTEHDKFIVKQGNVSATPLIQGDFSSGRIGINQTDPTYTFDVNGTMRSWGNLHTNQSLYVSGNAYVTGGILENGTTLSAKYLGINSVAQDSLHLGALGPDEFLRSNATDYLTGTIFFRGDIVGGDDGFRHRGVFGNYDSTKTDHIWSMGTAYRNASDGSNFGNLYGFGYKHTNNPTGGTMAGGHQAVWCSNGTPQSAIGTNLWTSGDVIAAGQISEGGSYLASKYAAFSHSHAWSEITSKPSTLPPPIGATYVQFPGESDPGSLWSGTTWSTLFDTEGIFFRTEGGNALAFGGGVQTDELKSHSHTYVEAYNPQWKGNGTNSKPLHSTMTSNTSSVGGTETRPRNRTIRVWVRTA